MPNVKKQNLLDVYPGEDAVVGFTKNTNGSVAGMTFELRIDLIDEIQGIEENVFSTTAITWTNNGSSTTKAVGVATIPAADSVLLDYTKEYVASLWKTSPSPVENVATMKLKPNKPRRA